MRTVEETSMKNTLLRIGVALILSVSVFGCAVQKAPSSQPAASAPSYTCATCGGTYERAGNCPKCGVDLTLKRGASEMRK
jgi:hypothetical protein